MCVVSGVVCTMYVMFECMVDTANSYSKWVIFGCEYKHTVSGVRHIRWRVCIAYVHCIRYACVCVRAKRAV